MLKTSNKERFMSIKKVLVIGGGGYVGSQLVPRLISLGYKVTVYDTFWFGSQHFKPYLNSGLSLVKGDIRNLTSLGENISNQDAVIHLACISNDPSFDLNPGLGKSINLDPFLALIQIAKKRHLQRFIYASTSSVYGVKQEDKVTELLTLNPLTDYSKYKSECESILLNEVDKDFTTVVFRPATVCGYSLRQRFDLSVNILTAHAMINKKILVFGGAQFRPNLHIEDMVDAYVKILEAPDSLIHRNIFNVGGENLSMSQIANTVKSQMDFDVAIEQTHTDDLRSYRIDSTKIKDTIGFAPKRGVKEAVIDIKLAFNNGLYNKPFNDSKYINISRMKDLNLG
jgi:nucleoside-diphosphate-sugar epimerase